MQVIKRRILRYASTNGTLPTALDQLPRMEGYDNEVVDAWGKPIDLHIKDDKVTLTSYGRDGMPGGTGDDADMVGVFKAKTATGAWADELCNWDIDPYGRQRQ
jgi:hypothetical protein